MIQIWFSFDSAFHNLWHELLSLDSAYALLHGLHQCVYCTSEGLQGSSTHRSQIKNHKINMHTTPDIVMPAQSLPRCFSDWLSRHTSSPVSGVASVSLRHCHIRMQKEAGKHGPYVVAAAVANVVAVVVADAMVITIASATPATAMLVLTIRTWDIGNTNPKSRLMLLVGHMMVVFRGSL